MAISFDLSGKVALVTGANTGIGQGIALALAGAGADLVLVGHLPPEETISAAGKLGRKTWFIEADLLTIEPVEGIVQQALDAAGRIDILVNNAGIIRRADSTEFSERDWDEVMNINVKTVFFMCQRVGRHMIERGSGKIINIASMLSFQGGIRVPSYTASKSGVAGITRLLANEWAGKGININAIAPGYVATDNTAQLRADPERSQAILDRIPAGRWASPEDMGGAAVFLASPASDYVQGHVLAVDGGWLAR
ncbi:2-dehydro-3-deoxy-D-gluconate 5-dehydrogenase KduD [Altericroceibacterium xinjiangense]|uniref:2-dehydro-3-deoxy-D-gluconate 5-dehydrogenase KduD n=1 Tax=Altericroceibacterium xinjiangense TaxID=762261 RepID=UPI000F7EC264|nr:2-dehydro-3-deoxy-D-gluconate 5-dehydrogenase KduD [Altericroceibacterium xinjiangense]